MLVWTSVAVTATPGTAPPLESVMFPRSVPVTACAAALDGTRHSAAATASAVANRVAIDIYTVLPDRRDRRVEKTAPVNGVSSTFPHEPRDEHACRTWPPPHHRDRRAG